MDEDPIRALAAAVQRYLKAHPDAADTAEGILRWWLPESESEVSLEQMERALELLVAGGGVVQRRMADGRRVYARSTQPDGAPTLN